MTSWNYRLTKQGGEFAVREVYYDEYNVVVSWTASPVTLSGESRKEVLKDMQLIADAMQQPVLDLDRINRRMNIRKVLNEHLNNGCTDARCDIPNGDDFTDGFLDHLTEAVQGVTNDQP